MPSTYTNDLRIEEQATGENSGTWGTKVNSAFSQIAEAFSYGTQDCFSSDADATTTVADGATDPARAMYFKVTSSATLTATRTLTIAPNTISRVMFIENATTGSQSIAISQGSGANVTIGTGKTKVVYLDGAGATAAVVDAMAKVDPGVNDTLAEILAAGNATGGTDIAVGTGDDITFADSSKAIFGAGSDLQIYHDGSNSYITNATNDLLLDLAGDIIIDADGGDFIFRDGGNNEMTIKVNDGSNVDFISQNADHDMRFRGVDGASTITALTLDMSDAGTAAFNSGATFGGNVGIGGSPAFSTLEVIGDKTESNNLQLTLKGSTNTNKQMIMGFDTTADTAHVTTQIAGSSPTPLIFKTGNVVFNENSTDSDFRIESDNKSNMLFLDAGNDRIGIACTPNTTFHVTGPNQSGYGTMTLEGNADEVDPRLTFYGFSTTAGTTRNYTLDIFSDVSEKGARYDVPSSYYQSWTIAGTKKMMLDSSGNLGIADDTPENRLTVVDTDGGSGIAVVKARTTTTDGRASYQIGNDAANWFMGIDGGNSDVFFISDAVGSGDKFVIGSTGNITQTNTSAGASAGPLLNLHRDSASPANNDYIGEIRFRGENDASEIINYAGFATRIIDVTDGAEDGRFELYTSLNGAQISRVLADSSTTIINQDSADLDFRVESDSQTHMLFVDAGLSRIGIQTSAPDAEVHISGSHPHIDLGPQGSNRAKLGYNYTNLYLGTTAGGGEVLIKNNIGSTDAPEDSGDEIARFGDTVTINESGRDQDFRVESDTNANALFVDAGESTVGINTSASNHGLTVAGGGTMTAGWNKSLMMTANFPVITWNSVAGSGGYSGIGYDASSSSHTINFWQAATSEDLPGTASRQSLVLRTGEVVVNETGADQDFRVESDGNSHMLFVDAGNDAVGIGGSPISTSQLTVKAGADANLLLDGASYSTWVQDAEWNSLLLGGAYWDSGAKFAVTNRGASQMYIGHDGDATPSAQGFIFSSAPQGTAGDAPSFENLASITRAGTVFNEGSADLDFRVESDGNANMLFVDAGNDRVGVGTNGPSTTFHVHGAAGDPGKLALSEGGAESRIFATRNSDTNGDLNFQTEISGTIATRMKIDYSGNVQVGQTVGTLFGQTSDNGVSLGGTGAIQAACATTVLFLNRLDASGGQVVRFDTNGTQVGSISTTSSATAYNTSSDQRLKDNIVDAPSASDDIDAIQVRSFDWKADGSHQKYGMVAQELVTVAPEAVSEGETEEEMMGVDYSKLVPMLVKEIQSLRARVAELETN